MTAVDDFQANPSHATHLNRSDLIRCDSHNTGPIRATDGRRKYYVLELLMRSCIRFEVQTLNEERRRNIRNPSSSFRSKKVWVRIYMLRETSRDFTFHSALHVDKSQRLYHKASIKELRNSLALFLSATWLHNYTTHHHSKCNETAIVSESYANVCVLNTAPYLFKHKLGSRLSSILKWCFKPKRERISERETTKPHLMTS